MKTGIHSESGGDAARDTEHLPGWGGGGTGISFLLMGPFICFMTNHRYKRNSAGRPSMIYFIFLWIVWIIFVMRMYYLVLRSYFIVKEGLNADPSECRHRMFFLLHQAFSLERSPAARKSLYYSQEKKQWLDERWELYILRGTGWSWYPQYSSMGGGEIFLHLCRLSPRHRLAAEAKVFLEG